MRLPAKPWLAAACGALVVASAVGLFLYSVNTSSRRAIETMLSVAGTPGANTAAAAAPSSPAPAVPDKLQRLREDLDNELRLCHLKLSNAASNLIESFEAFEGEIVEWGLEHWHYIQISPNMAALGSSISPPQEVSLSKNSSNIRGAVRDFARASREYQLEVERIKFAYSRQFSAISAPGSANGKQPMPDPKTEFEEDVLFALWLHDRSDSVLQLYLELINTYQSVSWNQQPPRVTSVLATLRLEFYKARGTVPDASSAEKQRAASILAIERLATALLEARKAHQSLVAEELRQVDSELARATEKYATGEYESVISICAAASRSLDEASELGISRANEQNARAARVKYESFVQIVPAEVIKVHGDQVGWSEVTALVADAESQSDAAERQRLYTAARAEVEKKAPELTLTAARAAFEASDYRRAFTLIDIAAGQLDALPSARQAFDDLVGTTPECFLALATEELSELSSVSDEALCCTIISCAYTKLGRVDEGRSAAAQALAALQRLPAAPRSMFTIWIAAHRLADAGPAESAEAAVKQGLAMLAELRTVRRDPPVEASWAAVWRGLGDRLHSASLTNAADQAWTLAQQEYANSALVAKVRRQLPQPKVDPVQVLTQHHRIVSLAAGGRAQEALDTAAQTQLAYTWGWLAICAVHEPQLRSQLPEIRGGIRQRRWARERDFLPDDSTTRYRAQGLARNDGGFLESLASAMDPANSGFDISDSDFFDFDFAKTAKLSSYAVRQRQERIQKASQHGLYLVAECEQAAGRVGGRVPLLSLTPLLGRNESEKPMSAAMRIARYVGLCEGLSNRAGAPFAAKE